MSSSRREFLKFVVAGSVAAGCPVNLELLGAGLSPDAEINGEHYDVCHQVRDGHSFSRPAVTRRCDVLIAGGGISGLSAAYFLRNHDFLLLEKEPHWGGNATLGESGGLPYATGSAFDYQGTASHHLAREIGLQPLPINSPDPTIVNGHWVADTWGAGLDQLPYSVAVRDSFKKFRADMLSLAADKDQQQFDAIPLSHYLKDYTPEIKQWWDTYGPSNYGAKSDDTSMMIALDELKDMANAAHNDTRVTLPGGNAVLSERLTEIMRAKSADRMISDAAIVAIEPQKAEVHITYVQNGALATAAAKFVIVATPKLIASRLVSGLPDAQIEAMRQFRYAPYAVVNMIFERPIYDRAYDTWCPGTSFADFVVADWVVRKKPGNERESNVLTFYVPLAEGARAKLLTIEGCRALATLVLQDFRDCLPEFREAAPLEVHLYRRGHAVFLSAPGVATRLIPAASRPLDRITFANTDSVGPESLVYAAVEAARRSAEWVEKRMSSAKIPS